MPVESWWEHTREDSQILTAAAKVGASWTLKSSFLQAGEASVLVCHAVASGLWKPQLPQAAVSTDFLRQASKVDVGKGWRELEVSQTAQEG